MTYKELLAKINKELEITHWEAWHEGARALRAVVELHKPLEGTITCLQFCEVDEDAEIHKCPSIKAIEKELR